MSDKVLLLKAVNQNWGMTGPGDWESIEWFVFSDRSYRAVLSFRPFLFDGVDFADSTVREINGSFTKKEFSLLTTIIEEEWIDPTISCHACDGEAWQIKLLYPSGRTKKSSGKLGYIYGQPIERLAKVLSKKVNAYLFCID